MFLNEIISFRPFKAHYISYCKNYEVTVTFTCLRCGSHNVRKRKDLHFFQGDFFCGDCGHSEDLDGYHYCYYSSCFSTTYTPIPFQLSFFDEDNEENEFDDYEDDE